MQFDVSLYFAWENTCYLSIVYNFATSALKEIHTQLSATLVLQFITVKYKNLKFLLENVDCLIRLHVAWFILVAINR